MIAAVALACWVMTGYKLRHLLRDRKNRALRYLCLTLASLSLSLSLNPFDPALDRIFGSRDAGMVIGNCLVVIAAGAAQAVLMYLPGAGAEVHRRVRNRNVVMLACVALLVAVFVLTPTPTPSAAVYKKIYILIYGGYVAWAAAQGAILSLRFARSATQVLLRLGLRLAVAGSLLGVCYATVRVVDSFEYVQRLADIYVLVPALYTTTTVTLLVAATIPSWGPRIGLDRAMADLSARRDCRRLQPLWALVYRAAPEVTLLPHPTQPSLRRVRMIVEILDGYVRLAPWVSEAAAQYARTAGTGHDEMDAATEARLLTIAARDKLAGRPPTDARTVTVAPPSPLHPDGEAGAAAQVAWLIRVAQALHGLRTTQTPSASQLPQTVNSAQ
jgi:hypothetical protein